MTHDFRPGDVVEYLYTVRAKKWRTGVVSLVDDWGLHITKNGQPAAVVFPMGRSEFDRVRLVSRPGAEPDPAPAPTEHPSRARAASSLRAASASLATAIDHITRAGEAETYPGQTVIRIRTASEETQACIQHATMAMYWMLHERLGS